MSDSDHPFEDADGLPLPEATGELFERLKREGPRANRYRIVEEFARGGMGAILRVFDEELRRSLAMKVILGKGEAANGETPAVDAKTLGRFLEEAQVTGQLDHPGIVPVHEMGLDAEGRVFFTMRLVKGEDLRAVFDHVKSGKDGWSQTRALHVLLKVCDAVSYAHAKGVIHRDLKPANVMVGKFGEVYVMDWGLARVLGCADRHDLRLREVASPLNASQPSLVSTEREADREATPDSPLVTMDGDVVGTPSFMPPEQAEGKIESIGPHSDVYALGAMLYQLVTGRMPYVTPGARMTQYTILARVLEGPPEPAAELAPDTPAELLAILEKAMERDAARRYRTMQELAADLRAYLEGRVVAAYETGAIAELKKWVERNKALAASLAAGVVLAVGAVSWNAWTSRQHAEAMIEKNRDLTTANALADANAATARDEATRADAAKREAEANLADVLRLGDIKRVRDLEARAQELWPAWPELVPEIERWIADAREVTARLEQHRASLEELRAKALPPETPVDRSTFTAQRREAQVQQRRKDLAELDAFLAKRADDVTGQRAAVAAELRGEGGAAADEPPRREWRFAPDAANTQWRHDQLAELVDAVEALQAELAVPEAVAAAWKPSADEPAPAAAFVQATATIAAMQRRIDHAAWVEEVSLDEALDDWREAIARIAKNAKYAAFAERPFTEQFGLVPIGPDPESGLEEFWHVETGARPQRDPTNGKFTVTAATAMVFVLLPGGTSTMGSRQPDTDHPVGSPHVDPRSEREEQPPHAVTLAPFFMSKFEMTRAQWLRVAGNDPSRIDFNGGVPRPVTSPVESIDWSEAQELAERLVARLPTDAQWEYAARAGTTTVYWCGDDPATIKAREAGNVFDEHGAKVGYRGTPEKWNDGYADVAPVGTFAANPFGLHDVIGNVWESCADEYAADYQSTPARPGDGERSLPVQAGSRARVLRGGGWDSAASFTRSAFRLRYDPALRDINLGLRPARVITW